MIAQSLVACSHLFLMKVAVAGFFGRLMIARWRRGWDSNLILVLVLNNLLILQNSHVARDSFQSHAGDPDHSKYDVSGRCQTVGRIEPFQTLDLILCLRSASLPLFTIKQTRISPKVSAAAVNTPSGNPIANRNLTSQVRLALKTHLPKSLFL